MLPRTTQTLIATSDNFCHLDRIPERYRMALILLSNRTMSGQSHAHQPTLAAPKKWHGGKWIRPNKRARIYLRDSSTCVYCGCPKHLTPRLTLDHVKARSKGGTNAHTNLVTACLSCNSAKQDRTVSQFAAYLAHTVGIDPTFVIRRVRNATRRKLPKTHTQKEPNQ